MATVLALRDELLADDLAVHECMSNWSEEQVVAYFESNGVRAPTTQLVDLRELLVHSGLSHLESPLRGQTVGGLLDRFLEGRQVLLRHLLRRGLVQPADRQSLTNALAACWREGRLAPPPPPGPLPPPAHVLRSAVAAIGDLRRGEGRWASSEAGWPAEAEPGTKAAEVEASPASGDAALRARLVLSGLAAHLDLLCSEASDEDATERLLSADPTALRGALEGAGMPLEHARLLLHAPRRGEELKIAFYSNQLGERGTEVALFDYADAAERRLGATSFVLYKPRCGLTFDGAVAKFESRFGERALALGWDALVEFVAARRVSALYVIKEGHLYSPPTVDEIARVSAAGCRTIVHAVFSAKAPHGDVFARIAPCVPASLGAQVPVVPHMVRPASARGPDMRAELGIPTDATVFGRHGGYDTMNIGFVLDVVEEFARERPSVFFVLLNTAPFCATPAPPNVLHLRRTADEHEKARFIRTCDAMLHARAGGETFGLAVAEFSAHNRPVITSSVHTDDEQARMHLDALGTRGLYYQDAASLRALLLGFDRQAAAHKDWNAYRAYEPSRVMELFRSTFLPGGDTLARQRPAPEE